MRVAGRLLLTLYVVRTFSSPNGLAGAFAPPALKGVDNRPSALPTGFACRCAALRVDKVPGCPPHALPPCFENFPSLSPWKAQGGGAVPGVPEHGGGLALPRGLGAQPPAVGGRRPARDARGGFNASPLWGDICHVHIDNVKCRLSL